MMTHKGPGYMGKYFLVNAKVSPRAGHYHIIVIKDFILLSFCCPYSSDNYQHCEIYIHSKKK